MRITAIRLRIDRPTSAYKWVAPSRDKTVRHPMKDDRRPIRPTRHDAMAARKPTLKTKVSVNKERTEKSTPKEVRPKEDRPKEDKPKGPEPVKLEESEAVRTTTKPVESSDGKFELNPLMSTTLENELQALMTEVGKELEIASTDAEKLVTDKFKNEAGKTLKNLLGLNATMRLLHIHNPLLVKVVFDKPPLGEPFKHFVRWLNCTALKRVPTDEDRHRKSRDTYVAQLRKVEDFDRVCQKKTVRISNLKATAVITPFYKYEKCPTKIKTPYGKHAVRGKTGAERVTDAIVREIAKQDKEGDQCDNTEVKDKSDETKNTQETAKIETKPAETSNVDKPNVTENKVTPVKRKAEETIQKSNKETVPKPNTTKATPKVPEKVPTKQKKVEFKTPTQFKTPSTSKPKYKNNNKTTVTNNKETKVDNQSKNSDFDELNDEDILTLSNAIILDECSGSDDE